jgi:midasin
LELLLLRAQLWQETAARHVSLGAPLAPLAGLAARWRRLELAAWRRLLRRTAARAAAGALPPPVAAATDTVRRSCL